MENKITANTLFVLLAETDNMTLCDLLSILHNEKVPMTEAVEELGKACQAF